MTDEIPNQVWDDDVKCLRPPAPAGDDAKEIIRRGRNKKSSHATKPQFEPSITEFIIYI